MNGTGTSIHVTNDYMMKFAPALPVRVFFIVINKTREIHKIVNRSGFIHIIKEKKLAWAFMTQK